MMLAGDSLSQDSDTYRNGHAQQSESPRMNDAALYEQAQKYMAEGKLEMAIATYERLLQQANGNYQEASANLQKAREQLQQKQAKEQAEKEYIIGMALLRARDWTGAISSFEKAMELNPNFRDTRRRLAQARRGLERESTEAIVARYYADGVMAMNRNDLGSALTALEKVRQLNPDYRDVASLIAEIERTLGWKSKAAELTNINLDSLYQASVNAMEKEDWMQAVVVLEKLQVLQPNYRDADHLLADVRAKLLQMGDTGAITFARRDGSSSSLFVGGAVAALIVLPLLGVLVFSPSTRARYYMLRSDYGAAAKIYEGLLARHPQRTKIYPALANLYLLMGRHDEQALKIYKTVLQLNFPSNNREEINSIVAQRYLTEGRTDSDAIEVLENALRAERRRLTAGPTTTRV
jgi:tetratricopeptide (TPR) repeat protein